MTHPTGALVVGTVRPAGSAERAQVRGVLADPGLSIRFRRICHHETGRFLIIPMDHGITVGAKGGLEDLGTRITDADRGGATAVVLHKGEAARYAAAAPVRAGLIIHISGSIDKAPDPNRKVLVSTVEEALRFGADCVSVHVNIGADTTAEMISDCGAVARACHEWSVPLLVMVYPRGPAIKDQFEPSLVAHCARAVEELGADIVKTNYTGDPDSFREVVRSLSVPVITAGGPPASSPLAPLEAAAGTIAAGGAGVACGRNVFGHRRPEAMTRAMAAVIFEGAPPEEAARRHLGV